PAFVRSIPLEKALHPATVLAYAMNGSPLPALHGAPLRAVVPGWVGDDWIKWLTSIRLDEGEDTGFYMATGYRYPKNPIAPGDAPKPEDMTPMTSLVVKTLIARPSSGQVLAAGKATEIRGVAFAGEDTVAKVDVSIADLDTDARGPTTMAAVLEKPGGL